MKAIFFLLLTAGAMAETMTLDENYNLVPYQDYSQRADIDREQRADVRGSLRFTENEQRGEVGVWFKFGNPVKQLKAWHNELTRIDYQPDYSFAMAQASEGVPDVPYEDRTTADDILSILEDTKPQGAVEALGKKVTVKGVALTTLSAFGAYLVYDEFIRESDKDDKPEQGIKLKTGEVFISDTIATGREVSASLGSSGSSNVSIGTFDSSKSEEE